MSLFPPAWNDRPNGLRTDLMALMQSMKPTFLRFPGGNYLQGKTLATRFVYETAPYSVYVFALSYK